MQATVHCVPQNMPQPAGAEFEPGELEQVLGDLKCSLKATQRALLSSNLAELELQTSRQQVLCHQIAHHRNNIEGQKVSESVLQTAEACRRAARLQSALLKRLQRGLGLMTLFQSHPAITYEPPRQFQTKSEPGRR